MRFANAWTMLLAAVALAARTAVYDRIVSRHRQAPFVAAPAACVGNGCDPQPREAAAAAAAAAAPAPAPGAAAAPAWVDTLFDVVASQSVGKRVEADYEDARHGAAIIQAFDSYNIGLMRRFPWSSPHEAVVELALRPSTTAVLDLGCGAGKFVVFALRRSASLRATCVVDSARLAAAVERHALHGGVRDRLEIVRADFDAWRPPRAAFDVVVSLESLGYSRNRTRLLAELHASLRPGGRLFVKTPTFVEQAPAAGLPMTTALAFVEAWRYGFSTRSLIAADLWRAGFSAVRHTAFPFHTMWLMFNGWDLAALAAYVATCTTRATDHVNLRNAWPWHPLEHALIEAVA
jgi:SAM-dependent methyltransferase